MYVYVCVCVCVCVNMLVNALTRVNPSVNQRVRLTLNPSWEGSRRFATYICM